MRKYIDDILFKLGYMRVERVNALLFGVVNESKKKVKVKKKVKK